MAELILKTLTGFEIGDYFSDTSIIAAEHHGSNSIRLSEASWKVGRGPVWESHHWNSQVIFGFKLVNGGVWSFISNCSKCAADGCWHVVAVGNRVVRTQSRMLDRWQMLIDVEHGRPAHEQWKGQGWQAPQPRGHEEQFQQWLAGRDMASRSAKSTSRQQDEELTSELIFVIDRAEGRRDWRMALKAGTSRKMKTKSAMVKTKWLDDQRTERPDARHLALPLYERYARWCASNFGGMSGNFRWSHVVLDASGMEMVKAAAEAGRLYIHDDIEDRPVGPATWAPMRALRWNWEEKSGDTLAVKYVVEGGGHAFFGEVPMYADMASAAVGLLDLQGMDSANAEMVTTAPLIPRKWLSENAQTPLALKFLPRPPDEVVKRHTKLIQGIVPTPVLTVEVKERKEIFALDLAFRYDVVLEYFTEDQEKIQFIKRAGETIELVRDIEAEGRARHAMSALGLARSPAGDWRFLGDKAAQVDGFRRLLSTDFAQLREAGFEIAQVSGWSSMVQQVESIKGGFAGQWKEESLDAESDEEGPEHLDGTGLRSGLEFSMGFVINGQRYNLLPLVPQIVEIMGGIEGINRAMAEIAKGDVLTEAEPTLWAVDDEGRWIGLPRRDLVPWLSLMAELLAGRKAKEMAAPSIVLSRIEALRMQAEAPELDLGGSGEKIIRELLAAKKCTDEVLIEGFTARLEPFQRSGVHWMRVLGRYGLGGMLGDDRGLGKTVQCIAHLQEVKSKGQLKHPALIAAIPTQVRHWEKHLHYLAPGLKVLVLGGTERHEKMGSLANYDAVVTTWEKIPKDIEALRKQRFQMAFLDETEKIHNSQTNMAKAVRLLDVGYAIACNGSPLENHYGDIWAVFDAVLHGLLGGDSMFKRNFRTPIEELKSVEKLKLLRKRLAPFLLRRLKKDSGVSLPPVQHQDVPLRIKGEQANLYEAIRITTEEKVKEALEGGFEGSKKGRILTILTKLRQVCCDPRLTEMGRERNLAESAKLKWIEENIPVMVEEGRRVLVVAYFSEFFDLIGPVLKERGIAYSMIRQGVNNREAEKEAFKAGRTRVFLLGLKSGGRGTDLPEADTVCHLDPWWNPKSHDQATDRAHRMGQQNTVLNLRLFIEGSFEERVMEIQERKRLFADSLDDESVLDEGKITEDDIREMLRPLRDLDDDGDVSDT
jgi:SNF2-related domain/Helicase conserved C-terminal domain